MSDDTEKKVRIRSITVEPSNIVDRKTREPISYNVHVNFEEEVSINCEEIRHCGFEMKEIQGIKFQVTPKSARAMNVHEYQLSYILPGTSEVITALREFPIRKGIVDMLKEKAKASMEQFRREDLGLK